MFEVFQFGIFIINRFVPANKTSLQKKVVVEKTLFYQTDAGGKEKFLFISVPPRIVVVFGYCLFQLQKNPRHQRGKFGKPCLSNNFGSFLGSRYFWRRRKQLSSMIYSVWNNIMQLCFCSQTMFKLFRPTAEKGNPHPSGFSRRHSGTRAWLT